MKYLYPVFALILFLSTGCSIGDRIERREDRLIGTWVIDRASFDEDGALFNSNITDDFRGDRLTFFPDGTVEYRESNGEIFAGPWFIDAFRDLSDDTEFTLDADFFDRFGFLAFRWSGTIQRLNQNNFNLNVAEVDGTLRMRWDKL